MTELLLKSSLFGLGGLLVGAMHTLSHYVTDPAPDEIRLGASYRYLQTDAVLLQTLQTLDTDFRDLHPNGYIRTIQALDALLGLRSSLGDPCYEPVVRDRIQGVLYFRAARTALQCFLCRAEKHRSARHVVHLQRDLQTLMQRIDAHLRTVVLLTRDIHIRPTGDQQPRSPRSRKV
jgi:hypothetical protein